MCFNFKKKKKAKFYRNLPVLPVLIDPKDSVNHPLNLDVPFHLTLLPLPSSDLAQWEVHLLQEVTLKRLSLLYTHVGMDRRLN